MPTCVDPAIHTLFRASNVNGLTTVLRGKLETEAVSQPTAQENLSILTTGPLPPNPAELLGSQRMRTLVAKLQASYDLLILDSSPIHNVTDAVVLSSFLDATLLVVGAKRGRRSTLLHAREALGRASANVLGTVLNGAADPGRRERSLYYGAGAGGGDSGREGWLETQPLNGRLPASGQSPCGNELRTCSHRLARDVSAAPVCSADGDRRGPRVLDLPRAIRNDAGRAARSSERGHRPTSSCAREDGSARPTGKLLRRASWARRSWAAWPWIPCR